MGLMKKIASKAGIESEEIPTEDERARHEREEKIRLAWLWLRREIDRAINEYFSTGSTERLSSCVVSPAYERLLGQLEVMKSSGQKWSFPDRERSQPHVEILEEQVDSRGIMTAFSVQERFFDRSVLTIDAGDGRPQEVRGDSTRRVLQATVRCPGTHDYQLQEVRQVVLAP